MSVSGSWLCRFVWCPLVFFHKSKKKKSSAPPPPPFIKDPDPSSCSQNQTSTPCSWLGFRPELYRSGDKQPPPHTPQKSGSLGGRKRRHSVSHLQTALLPHRYAAPLEVAPWVIRAQWQKKDKARFKCQQIKVSSTQARSPCVGSNGEPGLGSIVSSSSCLSGRARQALVQDSV